MPQVWLGYQQSLRPAEKGLTLNVDIAATAFLEQQPVIEYMARLAGLRDVRELKTYGLGENARKVSKGMQGIKVRHHRCTAFHLFSLCCSHLRGVGNSTVQKLCIQTKKLCMPSASPLKLNGDISRLSRPVSIQRPVLHSLAINALPGMQLLSLPALDVL